MDANAKADGPATVYRAVATKYQIACFELTEKV